jgi:hypothetical protein
MEGGSLKNLNSDAARLRKLIFDTIEGYVSDFLLYDRENDKELPQGAIEKAVENRVVTTEEIVWRFRECLFEALHG